jgi:hypothetical protein
VDSSPKFWFLHLFWCRIFPKKILISAQNPENKGSFSWPPRSMLLKVVRGKILETWELAQARNRLRFRFGTAGMELRQRSAPSP